MRNETKRYEDELKTKFISEAASLGSQANELRVTLDRKKRMLADKRTEIESLQVRLSDIHEKKRGRMRELEIETERRSSLKEETRRLLIG